MSPFKRLSAGTSAPNSTIFLRRRSIPLTSILPMLFNGYIFASFIALVALLSEALVITLSGVPFNPGQIYLELLICSYASMAILALMIGAMGTVIWWKWRLPVLPRKPETVAAVMSYLCA